MARKSSKETAADVSLRKGGGWNASLRGAFKANSRLRKAKPETTDHITERYRLPGGKRGNYSGQKTSDIADNIKNTAEQLDKARLALRPDLTPPPGVSLEEHRRQLRKERRETPPLVRRFRAVKSAIGRAISEGMAKSPKWAAHKRSIRGKK